VSNPVAESLVRDPVLDVFLFTFVLMFLLLIYADRPAKHVSVGVFM
jgi:hypothetical protein